MLTPNQYDLNERQAIEKLPNRITEAFQPEAFNLVGYPTRVGSQRELHRYTDVMHETWSEGILELFLGGLTQEEFELFKEVSAKTHEFTRTLYGKPVLPMSALLWALLTLRHVRSLFPNPDTTILEIGPGSGYFGCLCGLLGYKYMAMDVTQAFYLFQSNLWETFFGKRFVELATATDLTVFNAKLESQQLVHVPWWRFANTAPLQMNLDVDCIACVDVIAEMHVYAMRYLGRQAARWLRNSDGNKVVYFQGTGAQLRNNIIDIRDAFRLMSLKPVWSDTMGLPAKYAPHDLFFFFCPDDRPYRLDPSSSSREPLGSVVAGRSESNEDQLQEVIIEARQRYRAQASVDMCKLRSYCEGVVGHSEIGTDDERFWHFCNRDDWKWY